MTINNTQSQVYDVVIMGAGIGGVCQARHLLLNVPNIKIALIDPRPEERTDRDMKVGESTVEISTLMICKELGLYDYMIENHPPKFGLNFHWAKEAGKTETTEDYYHIWTVKQPPLASVLINRPKFERDLLKMNQQMGAEFYNGRVVDVDLPSGDELNTVHVKMGDRHLELKAKHVIDSAGRKFLIGRKKDNVITGPENLYGINNGSVWMRVRNVDRSIFHSGYDPDVCTCSHYYAANHWMGHGHWVWMLPTDTQNMELSIGLLYHHDIISPNTVNNKEKFYAFLEANHNVVYRLLKSGEEVDFHHWPKIAHKSKQMYSQDNWYIIGDAAAIFDPFYSQGLTMMSFQIESVTEIIRAKLAGEANAQEKCALYNRFALNMVDRTNVLVSRHEKQIGDASIMTWRMYLENIWWFKMLIPMFVGKWHLDVDFLKNVVAKPGRLYVVQIMNAVYEHLDELVERKANIGFLHTHIADQLPFGFTMSNDFDNFLHLTKYEPQRANIYVSIQWSHFFVALWYLKFLWKAYGLKGVLAPRNLKHVFALFKAFVDAAWDHLIFRIKTRNIPGNSIIANIRKDFQNYRSPAKLEPWTKEVTEPSNDQVTTQNRELVKAEV
ncbi:MAG: tryptophan 7-halogenase [Nostoc sp. NMS1]|uniref:NAD(P)/FAD-dependent oxidoreductase n=1 Tax=unclassified Nostoc TaxID=2593658 RepID=UPI0025EF22A5|nr:MULTISPECIES: tryptophan 7-halogenase [unclassified Nostoc]MBN3907303.1 tryptophan 7-halogenase [Nostoc sp. NMS1]MBN3995242.1 tryptophan 7-halogenase [Nostoc sp. NMS2]